MFLGEFPGGGGIAREAPHYKLYFRGHVLRSGSEANSSFSFGLQTYEDGAEPEHPDGKAEDGRGS